MIATSLLYLRSKFELVGMNTCGSPMVRVDVFCCSVTKVEKSSLEQSYAMKCCAKLGVGATDTYDNIQKAFGNDSPSLAQVFRWNKDFVNGRETVEDEPLSGRPASVKTILDHVRAFIRQDLRLTIRMIAGELNINECRVHKIVAQDLNMRKLCAKMVPKI
jgi:hypothetical protein